MELSEDFLIWLILGISLHDLWPWINVNLLKSSRAFSCSDSFCQGKVMKTDNNLCINTTESRKSYNGYYRSYGVQNTIRFGPYEEQKGTFRIRLDNSGSKNTWNSWGMEGGGRLNSISIEIKPTHWISIFLNVHAFSCLLYNNIRWVKIWAIRNTSCLYYRNKWIIKFIRVLWSLQ